MTGKKIGCEECLHDLFLFLYSPCVKHSIAPEFASNQSNPVTVT